MSYTDADVERVAEAIKRAAVDADGTYPMGTGRFYEAQARAALKAMEREPLPFPDIVGDRDALRELINDDPALTEDQKREVYRIAEAIRVRVRSNYPELRGIGDRPDAWAYPARILLGMVPRPLEDVLHDLSPGTKICHVWPLLEGGYEAEIGVPVKEHPDGWWDHEMFRGEGATIDDAIRNAVANAKGDE